MSTFSFAMRDAEPIEFRISADRYQWDGGMVSFIAADGTVVASVPTDRIEYVARVDDQGNVPLTRL